MKKYFILLVLTLLLGIIFVGCQETFNPTTPTLDILKNTTPNNSVECLNFSSFSAGDDAEVMSRFFPGLHIYADTEDGGNKSVVVIEENKSPRAYGSGPLGAQSVLNGCLGPDKGIGIPRNESPLDNELYSFVFQFDEGICVNYFSLNTLDCGDYDPEVLLEHSIALVAYDELNQPIASDVHEYSTYIVEPALHNPLNPDFDPDPAVYNNDPGDACRSIEEEAGNYTYMVSGHGINKVVLEIKPDNGVDPFFGIRNICFVPEVIVPLDIKPTSCPNPINTKSKGVIPVAILGTTEFVVTQIDPNSILLEGVAPTMWAYEDVATPFDSEGYTGEDCNVCSTEGPDGFIDLTLKFEATELIEVIETLAGQTIDMTELTDTEANTMDIDGLCIWISITGNLLEEYGSTPIYGEDVVRILKKGK